jgi:hypothetical protein
MRIRWVVPHMVFPRRAHHIARSGHLPTFHVIASFLPPNRRLGLAAACRYRPCSAVLLLPEIRRRLLSNITCQELRQRRVRRVPAIPRRFMPHHDYRTPINSNLPSDDPIHQIDIARMIIASLGRRPQLRHTHRRSTCTATGHRIRMANGFPLSQRQNTYENKGDYMLVPCRRDPVANRSHFPTDQLFDQWN